MYTYIYIYICIHTHVNLSRGPGGRPRGRPVLGRRLQELLGLREAPLNRTISTNGMF